jgi:hypothetical protein
MRASRLAPIPEVETLSTARLVVWTLRTIAWNRPPCPGQIAALCERFGEAAPTAFASMQQLAFALGRLESPLATPWPPFVSALSADEQATASAIATGATPSTWRGPAAALATAAIAQLRRLAGEEPYPAAAIARAAS